MGWARCFTEQEVLELWQAEHRKLSALMRNQFLGHPSLVPLTRLPARFVMMFIVFLPAKTGRKTTLITYGPKKWGHVTAVTPGTFRCMVLASKM